MDGTLACNGCLYCHPWPVTQASMLHTNVSTFVVRIRCANRVLKIDTRNGSVELIGTPS